MQFSKIENASLLMYRLYCHTEFCFSDTVLLFCIGSTIYKTYED